MSLVVCGRSLAIYHLHLIEISEIDDLVSSDSSKDSSDEADTTDSKEMEVVRLVLRYEGEPNVMITFMSNGFWLGDVTCFQICIM